MWRCLKSPKRHKNNVIDVVLVSLLLTLKKFQTFFMCFYCWIWKSTCRRNEMMVNSSFTIQWEMLVKDKPGKTNMDVLTNLKKFVKKKKIKTRIAIFRQRNVNEIYLKKNSKKWSHKKQKNYEPFLPSERFHHRLVNPSRSTYIFPRMVWNLLDFSNHFWFCL